jgi:peptidoglycan hydrolase-like protein with peptidoglycan-binding domain
MEITVNERGSPLASTSEVMLVQETMAVLGLYNGPIDGIAASETMRAVKAYKKQRNMPVDNKLTSAFIEHIRNDT